MTLFTSEKRRLQGLSVLRVFAVKSFAVGVRMSFTADPDASGIRRSCSICNSTNRYSFCSVIDRVRNVPDEQWRIFRCRQCGFGWTEPLLSENEISGYYPATYFGEL